MTATPKGWGATEDITDACADCGCFGGHLPSCKLFEDTAYGQSLAAAYGPDMTNIGGYVTDASGNSFEIEDETPDGRHVVIQTGHGDTMIDLAEGWRVEDA